MSDSFQDAVRNLLLMDTNQINTIAGINKTENKVNELNKEKDDITKSDIKPEEPVISFEDYCYDNENIFDYGNDNSPILILSQEDMKYKMRSTKPLEEGDLDTGWRGEDRLKLIIDAFKSIVNSDNKDLLLEVIDNSRVIIINNNFELDKLKLEIDRMKPKIIFALGLKALRMFTDTSKIYTNVIVEEENISDENIIKNNTIILPTLDSVKIEIERKDENSSYHTNKKRLNEAFNLLLEIYKYKKNNPNETINNIREIVNGYKDMPARSEIILSYEQYKRFCDDNINNKLEHRQIGFDVETNALPVMDVNHEIIGFSLAVNCELGCYVPLKALDFQIPEEDKNKIIEDLKSTLQDENNDIWVYNCQHEVPVVYNNYGIFLKNIKDLYVMVKLLNCGHPWESGSRTLKYQVSNRLHFNDWSLDLDLYMEYFRKLNKEETKVAMKKLLSRYYEENELDNIYEKVEERYLEIKHTLNSKKVMSYENIPYKLIGRYGSLDSSSLFYLKEDYENVIKIQNEKHNVDLHKGFELWQKIHIAHIIMEMNGLFFNDKKAQKLDNWIEEQSINIMKQIVNSKLTKDWIEGNYWYEFSRNILMMNYIDEIIDQERYAKVVPGRNGITKDHIKLYRPTSEFLFKIRIINTFIEDYNNLINKNIDLFDDRTFRIYYINYDQDTADTYKFLFRKMYLISRAKPFTKLEIEYTKGEFIIKVNWQNFLLFYFITDFYENNKNLVDIKFNEWLKDKVSKASKFEDYKELFNVNSTIKVFRDYISDMLLTPEIKIAHTYYKLYEFVESADYNDFFNKLEADSKIHKGQKIYYDFLSDFESMMVMTKDEEVFSSKRLNEFIKLFSKYIPIDYFTGKKSYEDSDFTFFSSGLLYKRGFKDCFDWLYDSNKITNLVDKNGKIVYNKSGTKPVLDLASGVIKNYKLSTLDSGMIEHLTQLYLMLDCNIDDRSTWGEDSAFEFMFNYKFIKKLIKAKSTYIDGSTGRSNAFYIDKKYYLTEKFPKRLSMYELNNENNNVYDFDKAIEFELEDGNKVAFGLNEEVKLTNGTTKLAKDIQLDDDIEITKYIKEDFDIEDE